MAIYVAKGSEGDIVRKIQGALHLIQDGIFGSITEEAVKNFQRKNGLKADGIVGDKTWEAIHGKKNISNIVSKKSSNKKNKKAK